MPTSKPKTKSSARPLPQLRMATPQKWDEWLAKNHATSTGVGLVIPRKDKDGAVKSTLDYATALQRALAWGWIDGQKQKLDDDAWIQRFGPRRAGSLWSKINVGHAEALIKAGKMQPAGLAEVDSAKADGRWAAAYDAPSAMEPTPEFLAALSKNAKAKAAFAKLDAANRYAILWRLQTAKKAETRATRSADFVAMLARGDQLHPAKPVRAKKATKPTKPTKATQAAKKTTKK